MKRPFGQHFLFDPNILKKIIACSGVTKDDTVVEIGPGLGTLTKFLSLYAKKVIAIEIDKRLIGKLEEIFSESSNVEIVQADAMKYPFDKINGSFKVVANIPYNITTPLLFRLLEFKDKITSMTLLMQKEVAKRITATHENKEYGVLSITTRLYTKPGMKFTVSRKAFLPPPDIDSAVVHFDVHRKPIYPVEDEKLFIEVVKTAFSQRRKTIMNSLKKFDGIKESLLAAGIDPKLRPENLSIEDYVKLTDAIAKRAYFTEI
ncbi:MAG: ribosomal RNA small subunit methyltransferase A [Nitrospiraceae bacterium]|nr:MAG: ribosomal RNA small subunit methyltransferase A [Nitrospiraceae bacterium]